MPSVTRLVRVVTKYRELEPFEQSQCIVKKRTRRKRGRKPWGQKSRSQKNEVIEEEANYEWWIEVYIVDETSSDKPLSEASCFAKITYILHETFGDRQIQTKDTAPFTINEKAWGGFFMKLVFYPVDGGANIEIKHNLDFRKSESYPVDYKLTFEEPEPELPLDLITEVTQNVVKLYEDMLQSGENMQQLAQEFIAEVVEIIPEEIGCKIAMISGSDLERLKDVVIHYEKLLSVEKRKQAQ